MKKLLLILLASLGAIHFSCAQDPTSAEAASPAPADAVEASPAPPPVEPQSAASEAPPPAAPEINLETKAKSSFAMDESGRNPFWPIGWKPAVKTVTNERAGGSEVRETAFLVSSITLDQGARFAIINGKVMGEGQVFGLQMGSQTYQITVKAIQDGQVILQRRDQEIIVPLRRK